MKLKVTLSLHEDGRIEIEAEGTEAKNPLMLYGILELGKDQVRQRMNQAAGRSSAVVGAGHDDVRQFSERH